MKIVDIRNNTNDYNLIVGSKINPHLINLDKNKKNENKKILELCQIGKLIGYYFPEFEILEDIREKPDFIISNGKEKIGLEHERIVNQKAKEKEGFFENICRKVEIQFEKDNTIPNYLVNCYLKNDISFKVSDKEMLINKFIEIISEFVKKDIILENNFIVRMDKMTHSQKNIIPNFGGYRQSSITSEIIEEFILKKEKKIETYINNTSLKQWLILLIGSSGESSFAVNSDIILKIKTTFDKVFLYEDFKNQLFELK